MGATTTETQSQEEPAPTQELAELQGNVRPQSDIQIPAIWAEWGFSK